MFQVSWAEVKKQIDTRALPFTYLESGDNYLILTSDGRFDFGTTVPIGGGSSESQDFEVNYKQKGNLAAPVDPSGARLVSLSPFAMKTLPGSGKIFRRVHGISATLNANGTTSVILVIPYTRCKINKMIILWAPESCTSDFNVYDTDAGSYSGVPGKKLNQFAFGAGIAINTFEDSSEYDADLYAGMKIEALITNPTAITKTICINFILHEVKAP